MKATTKALIQAAKVRGEHHERKPVMQPQVAPAVLSPALLDQFIAEKWYTFSELAEKFGFAWDKIARDFKGRDGVAKFGNDYRVSESAVRLWLTEALENGKRAA
jgi:hypothetical protein